MPFAIFGTKPLLKTLIAEQKKTNRLSKAAAEQDNPDRHGAGEYA